VTPRDQAVRFLAGFGNATLFGAALALLATAVAAATFRART
jgi:hypothetical protein